MLYSVSKSFCRIAAFVPHSAAAMETLYHCDALFRRVILLRILQCACSVLIAGQGFRRFSLERYRQPRAIH